MRYLFSLPLPTLLVFCLATFLAANSSGQDVDDPFKPKAGKTSQNPFGKSDENPNAGNKLPAKEVELVEKRKDQKIQALKSSLDQMRNQNEVMHKQVADLKQRCEELFKEKTEMDQSVAKKNVMHQRIFEKLLNSDDLTQQQLALQHLMACIDQEGVPSDKLSLDVGKPEIFRRLSRLVESEEANIQARAARVFSAISRDSAIKLGFQFGPVWEPTSRLDSTEEAKIYRALREPIAVESNQQPLEEMVEEFQIRYGIHVALDKEVSGQTAITFKATGLQFDGVLARMLDKYDLAYRVMDDQILIMKKTDRRLSKSETYNVRGLLSEHLDIDRLIKLIASEFDTKTVSVNAVGQHKLVIKGTENDHRRVGQFLGSLAKPAKW